VILEVFIFAFFSSVLFHYNGTSMAWVFGGSQTSI